MWPLMAGSGWPASVFNENRKPEDLWYGGFAYKICPTGKERLDPVLPLLVSLKIAASARRATAAGG